MTDKIPTSVSAEARLKAALDGRRESQNFRSLNIFEGADFCSNDYLGLARHSLEPEVTDSGSTGSRLISGQNQAASDLEDMAAEYFGYPSALLFGSGYTANMGLLSCLGKPHDVIITDELIHASLIDGVRLTKSKKAIFKHNDLASLEEKLSEYSPNMLGQIYVVVESLYSMDGDYAPLTEMAALCETYNAALIVDEAHSVGVDGREGRGLVSELGLEDKVLACIYTFGKAVGIHGAMVCSGTVLRDYLINFCRPFIYSTAPSPHAVETTRLALERVKAADKERQQLKDITAYFGEVMPLSLEGMSCVPNSSPIQSIIIPGNQRAKDLAAQMQEQGLAVKAILSPTVAEGQERLRISLHSFNTREEIDKIAACVDAFVRQEAA